MFTEHEKRLVIYLIHDVVACKSVLGGLVVFEKASTLRWRDSGKRIFISTVRPTVHTNPFFQRQIRKRCRMFGKIYLWE